jgi:hypothetical protein
MRRRRQIPANKAVDTISESRGRSTTSDSVEFIGCTSLRPVAMAPITRHHRHPPATRGVCNLVLGPTSLSRRRDDSGHPLRGASRSETREPLRSAGNRQVPGRWNRSWMNDNAEWVRDHDRRSGPQAATLKLACGPGRERGTEVAASAPGSPLDARGLPWGRERRAIKRAGHRHVI